MTDTHTTAVPDNLKGLVADWSSDVQTFKVRWSKAMMWIFLLSDTFIFGSFLSAYMAVRLTTIEPWPDTSHVFALHVGGNDIPLLLIAIMTFILISSSGTMAMGVTSAYKKQRVRTGVLILLTALGGLTFVGMQAFEWTKLIVDEGIRPWSNDYGAHQFGSFFFMITGFHGLHVSIGRSSPMSAARRARKLRSPVTKKGGSPASVRRCQASRIRSGPIPAGSPRVTARGGRPVMG